MRFAASAPDGLRPAAYLFFCGRFQPSMVTWRARASVSLPSGASFVIVEPAPVFASAPIFTGATSIEPEPMNAPSPISVRHLFDAVVVHGDGAGADVDLAADRRVAEVGEVIRLAAGADLALLHFDEVADVHVLVQHALGPQARERADRAARPDRSRGR